MKLQLITTTIIVFCQISCAQNNTIVGKWQEYKTEWTDSLENIENPIGCSEFKYHFKSNGKLEDDSPIKIYNYSIKSEKIYVNDNPRFIIDKLNKDTLVLIDILPEDKKDQTRIHYFSRVNK